MGAPQLVVGPVMQALELADLEDEANMPLEQLLAQYGYTNNPDAAGPSHTASSPPHPAPQFPHLPDPSPPQVAASTHSRANDSSQQTKQKGSFPSDKGKAVAGAPGQPLGDLLSANMGVARAGTGEGVAQVRPEEQAEQAAAAGMDAFEHSQALAERRASGSQAEPSAPPAPGKGLDTGMSTAMTPLHHNSTSISKIVVASCIAVLSMLVTGVRDPSGSLE